MSTDTDLRAYYARRAAEYERIYDKPERQADLALLRERLSGRFAGRRLLEIACGTGYWTPHIARDAASVLALDANEAVLEIARAKPLDGAAVQFRVADAYALPPAAQDREACFAGFWWSHVPRARCAAFLAGLHARLAPGAQVVFLDNRFVEGSSTPLTRSDAGGDTFQTRRLADGSSHEVLKNFPGRDAFEAGLPPGCRDFAWTELPHYWLAEYRTPAPRT